MAIPLRLQPRVQPLEVRLQLLPVVLLRDPIHAHRRVRTLPAIRAFQGRHIDQMRQRVEPSFGFRCARSATFRSSGDMASKSRHWPCFPPEVRINTGRLCSAGSGCHPVPRRLRSYAALRLPRPLRPRLRFPLPRPTSMRALVLCPGRRRAPATRRASETGHRLSAPPELSRRGEGLPGYWAVLFVRAVVEHPAGYGPLAHSRRGRCCLQVKQHPGHPGRYRFRGRMPHGPHARMPTHRRARYRPRRKARYRLGRAHPWPGGLRTRWTTNEFHEVIATSNSL